MKNFAQCSNSKRKKNNIYETKFFLLMMTLNLHAITKQTNVFTNILKLVLKIRSLRVDIYSHSLIRKRDIVHIFHGSKPAFRWHLIGWSIGL